MEDYQQRMDVREYPMDSIAVPIDYVPAGEHNPYGVDYLRISPEIAKELTSKQLSELEQQVELELSDDDPQLRSWHPALDRANNDFASLSV